MMVIGRSKPNSKLSPRKGKQNGYAARSVIRDGSSHSRLRYGAGRLMGRFRLAAMREVRAEQLVFQCLYSGRRAILDSEGDHFAKKIPCPAPPIVCFAAPSSPGSK